MGAVVIFNHVLEFGIIFLVSDHPAHEKSIARKKKMIIITCSTTSRISDLLANKNLLKILDIG